jgi:hypothetical protein
MSKIDCPNCSKKIESEFHFCPWCAFAIKKAKEEENYGMIGLNDEIEKALAQPGLPFGLQGMIGGLMKQLEKELSGIDSAKTPMPKGFKIQISRGIPQNMQMVNSVPKDESKNFPPKISSEENERRSKLPKIDTKSVVRRLPEGIIYEIDAPGVKSVRDVVIAKLEQSIEIRAYSKTKCFVKSIPFKADVLGFEVENDKVLVKFKSQ